MKYTHSLLYSVLFISCAIMCLCDLFTLMEENRKYENLSRGIYFTGVAMLQLLVDYCFILWSVALRTTPPTSFIFHLRSQGPFY